jgi:HD-GYP domain-containing protein (c-di-GMP phosphodiesterase class II)
MGRVIEALEAESGAVYMLDVKTKKRFEIVRAPAAKFKGRRMGEAIEHVATKGIPYVSSRLCAVPLRAGGKTIGVVSVMDKPSKRPFDGGDLKVLASMANHFSVVAERRELARNLEERVKEFSTLNDVGTLMTSTLDETLIQRRAMEAATRLLDVEAGSLLIVDKEKKELRFEVALGEKGKKVRTVRLRIGEGIAGWVARYGRTAVIEDVGRDRRFLGKVDRKSGFSTRSVLATPVKIKGSVIGVLQAINKRNGPFTERDVGVFEIFSKQTAIALDNARLYREIRETFYSTSMALGEAIELRDPYTGGHTKRVLDYSCAIARNMGFTQDTIEEVRIAAILHDIGKIGIDDCILRKKEPLNRSEMRKMTKHPLMAAAILNPIPQLKGVASAILHHHERFAGGGYPSGIGGESIPLASRIIAVADAYDAMTTTRPYRPALSSEEALNELRRCTGGQFDGAVVRAFRKAFERGEI